MVVRVSTEIAGLNPKIVGEFSGRGPVGATALRAEAFP